VHPLFLGVFLLTILDGKIIYLLSVIVSSLLHELAHAYVAYKRGYVLNQITLMPYGASLNGDDIISKEDGFIIAISGPALNILLAIITTASWWTLPIIYNYTQEFRTVNLTLAAFNLLPIYPLDGSQIVLSLVKNTRKAIKILKGVGIAVSVFLFLAYIISFFIKHNVSLAIMATTILIAAVEGVKKESYKHIASLAIGVKNTSQPLEMRTLAVKDSIELIAVIKKLTTNSFSTFKIFDDKMNFFATLDEKMVYELCTKYNVHTQLKNTDIIKDMKHLTSLSEFS
jgi:stage IV sporulation protein FB